MTKFENTPVETTNMTQHSFIFFGTPDVSVVTLQALYDAGYTPEAIVTSPDRPSGRGMKLTHSPAKEWALEHNIEVLQPETIDADFIETLRAYNPALFVVIAYGKILPETLISLPTNGTINIHYSLLPRFRGASPIEAAILAGDTETGVSIQQMVYKLDAGPIIAEARVAIGPDETAPELRERLGVLGGELLVQHFQNIITGNTHPTTQDDALATRCGKFTKESGLLDIEKEDPEIMYRKYRAYKVWPRTYFFKNGKRHIITKASMKDGKFIIERVIPEGEKETSWYN